MTDLKAGERRIKQFIGDLKGIDVEGRTLTAMVSTDSVDRDGDVLVPAGWELENYRKNPVVLWAHDYGRLPIAKTLAIEPWEHGLMAMVQFAEHAFAQDVFQLYVGGFLRAFSVGFMPKEWAPRPGEGLRGYLITKAELLEFSAVPVPANQDALVLAAKAATLCGIGRPGERRPFDEAPPDFHLMVDGDDKPEHYLDLAEPTSPALDPLPDRVTVTQEEAEAQMRAKLAASLADLQTITQRIRGSTGSPP